MWLLQGNIPQDQKFQPGSGMPLALGWYRQQAHAALEQGQVRLVVAPETAIPLLPQQLPPAWWQPLLQGVQQGRSALMLGLHGVAFVLAVAWLAKRQGNWQLRDLLPSRAPGGQT